MLCACFPCSPTSLSIRLSKSILRISRWQTDSTKSGWPTALSLSPSRKPFSALKEYTTRSKSWVKTSHGLLLTSSIRNCHSTSIIKSSELSKNSTVIFWDSSTSNFSQSLKWNILLQISWETCSWTQIPSRPFRLMPKRNSIKSILSPSSRLEFLRSSKRHQKCWSLRKSRTYSRDRGSYFPSARSCLTERCPLTLCSTLFWVSEATSTLRMTSITMTSWAIRTM